MIHESTSAQAWSLMKSDVRREEVFQNVFRPLKGSKRLRKGLKESLSAPFFVVLRSWNASKISIRRLARSAAASAWCGYSA